MCHRSVQEIKVVVNFIKTVFNKTKLNTQKKIQKATLSTSNLNVSQNICAITISIHFHTIQ